MLPKNASGPSFLSNRGAAWFFTNQSRAGFISTGCRSCRASSVATARGFGSATAARLAAIAAALASIAAAVAERVQASAQVAATLLAARVAAVASRSSAAARLSGAARFASRSGVAAARSGTTTTAMTKQTSLGIRGNQEQTGHNQARHKHTQFHGRAPYNEGGGKSMDPSARGPSICTAGVAKPDRPNRPSLWL